ncbi:PmV-like protein [Crangon crangon nudivirus]|uniref:PmV-like protein n=1 Tax=Crangon crangon nudivirus TaxID=2880838 RepID=A0AAE8Y228_9VIRU|nr:PmV-like protein [Crangon crangon nudivirus]UBZ25524.1 PmV-like protein [Crangon crangon nudivirus]
MPPPDTYDLLVNENIMMSLSPAYISRMEKDPNDWCDAYMKFLIQIYTLRCNESSIRVGITEGPLFEPIMTYMDGECSVSSSNKNNISHIISEHDVLNYFYRLPITKSKPSSTAPLEFVPPKAFTKCIAIDTYTTQYNLSLALSENLLRLYVLADHAAYHYHRFVQHQDCDWTHKHIHTVMDRKNLFFHNLITNKRNERYGSYTECPKVLAREDGHHIKGYNSNYEEIFITPSTHPEDSSSEEEDED